MGAESETETVWNTLANVEEEISLGINSDAIFVTFSHHLGPILGPFWDNFGLLFESFWMLASWCLSCSFFCSFGTVLGASWGGFGVVFGTIFD